MEKVQDYLRHCGTEKETEAFNQIIIREKKHKLVLHLHEDLPSRYPPVHKARYTGKAVSQELKKIVGGLQAKESSH